MIKLSREYVGVCLALFFNAFIWGVYYTLSRFYFKAVLNLTFTEYFTIIFLECLPTSLSFIWGFLSDYYGWRKLILPYIITLTPSIMLLSHHEAYVIMLGVFLLSLSTTLITPGVLAYITSYGGSAGRSYAFSSIFTTLGFAAGSIILGVLYSGSRLTRVLTVMLTSGILTFTLLWLFLPERKSIVKDSGKSRSIINYVKVDRSVVVLTSINAMAYLAMEASSTIIALKLFYEVNCNAKIYGLILSTIPCILATMARPLAGVMVEKLSGLRTLPLIYLIYSILYYAMFKTHGLVTIMLWQIPLYAFYDVAILTAISEITSIDKRATAIGFLNAISAIALSFLTLLGRLSDRLGVGNTIMVSCFLLILSSILTLIFYMKGIRR